MIKHVGSISGHCVFLCPRQCGSSVHPLAILAPADSTVNVPCSFFKVRIILIEGFLIRSGERPEHDRCLLVIFDIFIEFFLRHNLRDPIEPLFYHDVFNLGVDHLTEHGLGIRNLRFLVGLCQVLPLYGLILVFDHLCVCGQCPPDALVVFRDVFICTGFVGLVILILYSLSFIGRQGIRPVIIDLRVFVSFLGNAHAYPDLHSAQGLVFRAWLGNRIHAFLGSLAPGTGPADLAGASFVTEIAGPRTAIEAEQLRDEVDNLRPIADSAVKFYQSALGAHGHHLFTRRSRTS